MLSLPESYQPTLQTITASEQASKLSGSQLNAMKADNLIAFIIKEAQHQVINDEHMKSAKSALAVHTKKQSRYKGKKKEKEQSDIKCNNCSKLGHGQPDCYIKGRGKEGQGLRQRNNAKEKNTAVIAVNDEEGDLFVFTCMLDYAVVAKSLDVPKSKLGTCTHDMHSHLPSLDKSKLTCKSPFTSKRTDVSCLSLN